MTDLRFGEGLRAFNAGRFHESHEIWEVLWLEAEGEEKELLQCLVQLAAACLKIRQAALGPATRLLLRLLEKSDSIGGEVGGVPAQAISDVAERTLERIEQLEIQGRPEFDPGWFPKLAPRPR